MALPIFGQIAMSQINSELLRGECVQISLDTAENGGYEPINPNSSRRPNATNPAAMSEWYGYDHGYGARVFPLIEIGFDATNFDRACVNAFIGRYVRIAGDGPTLGDCIRLYTNLSGTTFAARGYYSEGSTGLFRY
jgi:hypothetical protein